MTGKLFGYGLLIALVSLVSFVGMWIVSASILEEDLSAYRTTILNSTAVRHGPRSPQAVTCYADVGASYEFIGEFRNATVQRYTRNREWWILGQCRDGALLLIEEGDLSARRDALRREEEQRRVREDEYQALLKKEKP